MGNHQGILICAETSETGLTTTTRELLQAGSRLAEGLKQPLCLLLVGENQDLAALEAIRLGAGKVFQIRQPEAAGRHPEISALLIREACRTISPSIILLGQTDLGRDVSARLAAALDAAVTLDCVDLTIDAAMSALNATKPVYGGRALASWGYDRSRPCIVTLRPRSQPAATADPTRRGEMLPLDVALDESLIRATLVESIKEETRGVKLEEARVVITGGGGIGGREGFALLEELAGALGGAVAASRVPVDEGWVPKSMEIGQTGRIVSPDLYIAVGVSGAPQHMAGCLEAKRIVAINKDPEAPIFRMADFGVIGDYKVALPAFTRRCRELL